jgi:hypothetical protein
MPEIHFQDKVELKDGFIIGFYEEEKLVRILSKTGNGKVYRWRGGDDKGMAPHCVRTEKDFRGLVFFIANLMNLRVERDPSEWPYGPSYLLIP